MTRFQTVLPQLQRVHDDSPITGRTIEEITASGKWLTIRFSGDLFLLTHMLMNGSWHIYRTGERWHRSRHDMRLVIATEQFEAVAFNVPIAEFHTAASLARRQGLRHLGPDVLADKFDEQRAVANVRAQSDMPVGEALLRQHVIAGLGNVYKSEVCFACGINPLRKVSTLTEEEIRCLVATARKFMTANVTHASGAQIVTYSGFRRTTGRANPAERLWVYGRRGSPCRRCGTPIESSKEGGNARVTFFCPRCQR